MPGSRTSVSRSAASSISCSERRLREVQAKAEAQLRLDLFNKQKQLERTKLDLKLQEEELELTTNLAVAEARSAAEKFELDERLRDFDFEGELLKNDKVENIPERQMTVEGPDTPTVTFKPGLNVDWQAFVPSSPCLPPAPLGTDSVVEDSLSNTIMSSMINSIKRPTHEVKKFSGDPIHYPRFMRQFKVNILAHCDTYEEKLDYLEEYTSGEAQNIVKGFGYLEAQIGFDAALKELEERYGNREIIANAYVKRALSWCSIKSDDSKGLDSFSIFLSECENAVRTVESVKVLEYPDNMRRLVDKLPGFLQAKWRSIVYDARDRLHPITFTMLSTFVKKEAKKANDPIYGRSVSKDAKYSKPAERSKGSFGTFPNDLSGFSKPCAHCKQADHNLENCGKFVSLSDSDKSGSLMKLRLCFGCLRGGHQKRYCKKKMTCSICSQSHPAILHFRDKPQRQPSGDADQVNKGQSRPSDSTTPRVLTDVSSQQAVNTPKKVVSGHTGADASCSLAILPVRVSSQNGAYSVETYAFFDPGSTVSFCSENIMRKLNCHGVKKSLTIQTMGSSATVDSFLIKGLQISSVDSDKSVIKLPSLYSKSELPISSSYIPSQEDIDLWPHLKDIKIPVIENSAVELLLGNNVPDVYAPIEFRTGEPGSPNAMLTKVGWVIWNLMKPGTDPISCQIAVEEMESLADLEALVQKSIELEFNERACDEKKELSLQDKRFIEIVNNSIHLEDGKYCVDLLLVSDSVRMPDNYQMALSRLRGLRRKLESNNEFRDDYNSFMKLVIDRNFAELVPLDQQTAQGSAWYLPHHGVYHPAKHKIRVVFDASAKYHGVSLNDVLLQGPDYTNSLIGVLHRFREGEIAVKADIEKMFFCVRVTPKYRDLLRFLWWPDGDYSKEPYDRAFVQGDLVA